MPVNKCDGRYSSTAAFIYIYICTCTAETEPYNRIARIVAEVYGVEALHELFATPSLPPTISPLHYSNRDYY